MADPAAHVFDRLVRLCAQLQQARVCAVRVRDAPVHDRTARAGFDLRRVRIQAELVTADVEADVKRLIEVRLLAEHARIPLFRRLQIGDVIHTRAQAEQWFVCHCGVSRWWCSWYRFDAAGCKPAEQQDRARMCGHARNASSNGRRNAVGAVRSTLTSGVSCHAAASRIATAISASRPSLTRTGSSK